MSFLNIYNYVAINGISSMLKHSKTWGSEHIAVWGQICGYVALAAGLWFLIWGLISAARRGAHLCWGALAIAIGAVLIVSTGYKTITDSLNGSWSDVFGKGKVIDFISSNDLTALSAQSFHHLGSLFNEGMIQIVNSGMIHHLFVTLIH